MNEKQQQLTFDKGITNVPSDALCSDNALEESLGMVYDNGEHRVIQKPVVHMSSITSGYRLVYVHSFSGSKRYLFVDSSDNIHWCENNNGTKGADGAFQLQGGSTATSIALPGFKCITSIGKTLLVSGENGIHYYIWKENVYKSIGDKIPEPKFEFWLETTRTRPKWSWVEEVGDFYVRSSQKTEGIFTCDYSKLDFNIIKEDVYNDLVVGLYAKNKKSVAKKRGFCQPFFIRYALELYDGSYTYISNPILMFPNVTQNTLTFFDSLWQAPAFDEVIFCTRYSRLHYNYEGDFEDFSDIVKDVVIFISDGIELYDLGADQILKAGGNISTSTYDSDWTIDGIDGEISTYGKINAPSPTGDGIPIFALPRRKESEMVEDITSNSIFYRLCSIGLKSCSGDIAEKIRTNTLENLTTQEQLKYDDYFSRCALYPEFIYSYNSRLNLANVRRGFFEGFDFFIGWDNTSPSTYSITVNIKTDEGTKTVTHTTSAVYQKMDQYFFYPDARASHVLITSSGSTILDVDLIEHRGLNGAYYFAGLPQPPQSQSQSRGANREIIEDGQPTDPNNNNNEAEQILDPNIDDGQGGGGGGTGTEGNGDTENQGDTGVEGAGGGTIGGEDTEENQNETPQQASNNNDTELLPNYIIQSEVNNPWVYLAAGYFKVGTGKIIGMSTITQALSEGQFGQFPLLVFSESGIWSLSVASTGYYDTIHPMSREVSLDPACIVQTDGAVFFTSEKGLMVVVGNQVKCVSEQLSGRDISFMVDESGTPTEQTVNLGNFIEYLKEAFIAYDYRDSLLWIFNSNTEKAYTACWVYSIKSGTFGKYDFGTGKRVNNVVNFYPDYLMQNADGALSLLERPDINNDGTTVSDVFTPNTYNTKIITRPMKFENALALKSIMQIRHIKDFTPYTTTETVNEETVTDNWPKTELRIFASNNMDHWAELGSLRGMPWKYYKFRFDFTGLKATDRFSGSMIVTQERRTNKMR